MAFYTLIDCVKSHANLQPTQLFVFQCKWEHLTSWWALINGIFPWTVMHGVSGIMQISSAFVWAITLTSALHGHPWSAFCWWNPLKFTEFLVRHHAFYGWREIKKAPFFFQRLIAFEQVHRVLHFVCTVWSSLHVSTWFISWEGVLFKQNACMPQLWLPKLSTIYPFWWIVAGFTDIRRVIFQHAFTWWNVDTEKWHSLKFSAVVCYSCTVSVLPLLYAE